MGFAGASPSRHTAHLLEHEMKRPPLEMTELECRTTPAWLSTGITYVTNLVTGPTDPVSPPVSPPPSTGTGTGGVTPLPPPPVSPPAPGTY
jgi:hypothetical protein